MDPVLKTKPAVYGDFLLRLVAAGMVKWKLHTDDPGELGIFCLLKKDKKR